MSKLAQLIQQYLVTQGQENQQGLIKTPLTGVSLYRSTEQKHCDKTLYDSSIIFLGQGSKRCQMGDHQFQYDAEHYLVVGMPIPLQCEALGSEEEPILGLIVDVESVQLQSLVSQIHNYTQANTIAKPESLTAVGSVPMEPELSDAVNRLMLCLLDPVKGKILGANVIVEIIYYVLLGVQGSLLCGLVNFDGHYARIARSLNYIHKAFPTDLKVEMLASEAGMSLSAFHRIFRQVTHQSPLQYLKKIRLDKAYQLLSHAQLRANDAARQVGYLSPSQFSREFKRHFGYSPVELKTRSRLTI